MNLKKYILPFSLLMLVSLSGCGTKKPAAAEQREKWLLSLNDSISKYQKDIELVGDSLDAARESVGRLVGAFDYVNNPREVEGYYILNGWKAKYPLSSTSMVARINESEGFELIAALSGGFFNEIAVSAGGSTVSSDIVPHDQALNYRVGNFNTVCFSGGKADSIGEFISSHEAETITLAFLNGKRTGSLSLPSADKDMIARTWQLYAQQKELHRLEKELPRLSGKIAACRRMLESADSTKSE